MTASDKLAAFEEELKAIHVENVRAWVGKCIEAFPDYFFVVGASSTGKHHPYWSKGPGGTLRHTRAVFDIATKIGGTLIKDNAIAMSKIQAACILHDSFKYGITYDERLFDVHPYLPRALFKRIPWDFEDSDREEIFRAVESHMGSVSDGGWSLMPYVTLRSLRENTMCHTVHIADYLASREDYVDPRFKDFTEGPVHHNIYNDNIFKGLVYGRLLEVAPVDKVNELMLDKSLISTMLTRLNGLRAGGDRMASQYNYDDIIKTIDSNICWMKDSGMLGGE